MARLPPCGSTKDSEERATLRGYSGTYICAAMSQKHLAEPVVGQRREEMSAAEFGAGESGRNRIAAEGDGEILSSPPFRRRKA